MCILTTNTAIMKHMYKILPSYIFDYLAWASRCMDQNDGVNACTRWKRLRDEEALEERQKKKARVSENFKWVTMQDDMVRRRKRNKPKADIIFNLPLHLVRQDACILEIKDDSPPDELYWSDYISKKDGVIEKEIWDDMKDTSYRDVLHLHPHVQLLELACAVFGKILGCDVNRSDDVKMYLVLVRKSGGAGSLLKFSFEDQNVYLQPTSLIKLCDVLSKKSNATTVITQFFKKGADQLKAMKKQLSPM